MIVASHGIIGSSIGQFDADALAFFARVTAAGGTLSATERTAIDTLVKQMKFDGIWNSMKAIYPMVGASAAACAQNLKSSSFTGTFTATGWTFASTGVTPNPALSAFMNTNFNPSGILDANNICISVYLRSDTNGVFCDLGASSGSSYQYSIYARLTNSLFTDLGTSTQGRIQYANTNSRGHFISNRTSSTSFKSFINSTLKATLTTTQISPILSRNIFLSAMNDSVSTIQFSNRENAFASIGDGLTDPQVGLFYNAVQAFQTTLNRAIAP